MSGASLIALRSAAENSLGLSKLAPSAPDAERRIQGPIAGATNEAFPLRLRTPAFWFQTSAILSPGLINPRSIARVVVWLVVAMINCSRLP